MPKRGRSYHNSARKRRRYAGVVSSGISLASKMASRLASRLLRGEQSKASGVTNQHDSRILYKRKRAPRHVRSRAKRKYAAHLARQLKAIGQATYLTNNTQNAANAVDKQQCMCIISSSIVPAPVFTKV